MIRCRGVVGGCWPTPGPHVLQPGREDLSTPHQLEAACLHPLQKLPEHLKSQPAAAGVYDVRRVLCTLAGNAATHTPPRSQRPSAASYTGTQSGHAPGCRWRLSSGYTLTGGMDMQLRSWCVHRMQIVFSGDFLQLPPVDKMEKVVEPICRCACSAWS